MFGIRKRKTSMEQAVENLEKLNESMMENLERMMKNCEAMQKEFMRIGSLQNNKDR